MAYLSTGIHYKLQQVFQRYGMMIEENVDHIVVHNSSDCTRQKIYTIVKRAGFFPFILEHSKDRNFVFTIVPYRLPEFFKKASAKQLYSTTMLPIQSKDHGPYLTLKEITQEFASKKFVSTMEDFKDKWSEVNLFRKRIAPALNRALSEIISKYSQEKPIVEIGSGIGYTVSKELSERMIKTQPCPKECQLLSRAVSDPIYQIDIEGIYASLSQTGKKVSLFFALDVFDILSLEKRKESFKYISELQNQGDRIVILLDTNPALDRVVEHLASLYPKDGIYPYFPLTDEPERFALMIVPTKYIPHQPTLRDILQMIRDSSNPQLNATISKSQHALHALQKKFKLQLIYLEDFFSEQVKKELQEAGYASDVYYHASFVRGDAPAKVSGFTKDLVYKPVADSSTLRQWALDDDKLLSHLAKKGLKLPTDFDKEYLLSLRESGQKIFGAEILVIAATKT